jgi:hypothetical protein
MRRESRAWLVRRRLATQRVSGGPLPRAGDVVRLLTGVQAQDAPQAAWSLAMRSRRERYAAVLAEQAGGAFIRTHVLRPTWHLVAPEDLRWLLRLTSTKVESGMAARHRQLELDDRTVGAGLAALETLLHGGGALTRAELGPALAERGLPGPGERVGHLLLLAELRGLVCSGPPRGTEHTYTLLDEVLPRGPNDEVDRAEATVRLVRRFFGGHGPASERDLARWCTLTLGEIRAALSEIGDGLHPVEVEGTTLWYDPAVPARAARRHAAYLLPVFDEAFLSYADLGFPRSNAEVRRVGLWARHGGGVVVVDGRDIGMFARRLAPDGVTVTLRPDHRWSAAERDAAARGAQRLAGFVERDCTLAWE